MCGIVGYIGAEQAAPILLDGLSRLEYRGYDSAGVAVFDAQAGALAVHKAKGRLQVLSDQLHGGATLNSTVGVGHTRWATHGAPSDVNSHPQVSRSGKIAVVHNGIIENYTELKAFLMAQGVPFTSETDTEVVAQLIEYFYDGDLLQAVGRVLRRIQGAYALGILCADCPGQLVAVRKDSPLILGYGQGCNFIASDVTAILRHTRRVGYMEDGELAVLTREGIQCYNHLIQPIEKEITTVDWEIDAAEKGGYEHFMFKEIMEQRFRVPCEVENDVNCAGLAESVSGAAKGCDPALILTVGTGIGGCIVVGGKVFRGSGNSACEVGYMHMEGSDFQTLGAASILSRKVAEWKKDPAGTWNGYRIFEEAEKGDALCVRAIDEMTDVLGMGIANICYVINPEIVVLGGGIMAQEEYLRGRIERAVEKYLISSIASGTRIAFAKHKNDAGMLGAFYHFIQKQTKKDEIR